MHGSDTMTATCRSPTRWQFRPRERLWLLGFLLLFLIYGAILEHRTALRRVPMTDLGVFSCAAWAVHHGENLYAITDWHGWHYQYPPALAILFLPFEHPLPAGLPKLGPGQVRTEANTPWGANVATRKNYFGLQRANLRFACIVAVWYCISVSLFGLSAHALACALEGRDFAKPPPDAPVQRQR